MKLLSIFIGMVLAMTLIVFTPQSAIAACVSTSATASGTRLVDDDENNSYIRFYDILYYDRCSGFVVLKSIKQSYRPDTNHNTRLSCSGAVFDKIRMNPGPIAGLNPGTKEQECNPAGGVFTWNVKDTAVWSGDKCTTMNITIVKRLIRDWSSDPIIGVCM